MTRSAKAGVAILVALAVFVVGSFVVIVSSSRGSDSLSPRSSSSEDPRKIWEEWWHQGVVGTMDASGRGVYYDAKGVELTEDDGSFLDMPSTTCGGSGPLEEHSASISIMVSESDDVHPSESEQEESRQQVREYWEGLGWKVKRAGDPDAIMTVTPLGNKFIYTIGNGGASVEAYSPCVAAFNDRNPAYEQMKGL